MNIQPKIANMGEFVKHELDKAVTQFGELRAFVMMGTPTPSMVALYIVSRMVTMMGNVAVSLPMHNKTALAIQNITKRPIKERIKRTII